MIPETHPLANVYDSFNAIFINGNAVGDLMFYGRGAGDLPTGSAVVSDIIAILRGNIDQDNETFTVIKIQKYDRGKFKKIKVFQKNKSFLWIFIIE